ncbi:peptide chain release factor-like protein [Virgisporangium ochraceum]|nr:peptide chain release factor-like protein [Virgisporangium ochraceum]
MSTVVVEIRPGEGGDDAVAFATELTDAVSAHARRHGCRATVRTGRTITVTVTGRHAAGLRLHDLTGTHRIQRIPRNDRAGRRHTSTATVAVLDAVATVGPGLSRDDVDIDVYSGSGPGGQHRNKTEQCARLTHRPTGLVVVATASRSQRQNIEAAFAELERRLGAAAVEAAEADRNRVRRTQIATGERPQKQWTWNDQRAEVVDHSTGARYPMAAFRRGRFDLR